MKQMFIKLGILTTFVLAFTQTSFAKGGTQLGIGAFGGYGLNIDPERDKPIIFGGRIQYGPLFGFLVLGGEGFYTKLKLNTSVLGVGVNIEDKIIGGGAFAHFVAGADKWMVNPYAGGGLTFNSIKSSGTILSIPFSTSATKMGFFGRGGAQVKLGGHVLLFAEGFYNIILADTSLKILGIQGGLTFVF